MKLTPKCCSLQKCLFNPLDPSDNEQECIGCPYLKDPKWEPVYSKDDSK